jgi:hypothetical protein
MNWFRRIFNRSMTVKEAGRAGYITRTERERKAYRAKARAMCADMGKEIPAVLR